MGSQDVDPDALEDLTEDLAADLTQWFASAGRDLPWRRIRDPWTILISELMLQQTQVSRVTERLGPFVQQFPSPTIMAAGPAAAVIAAWSGLGYNRRALNLHRSALQMVQHHDGKVPRELDSLLALPGIGPYTARAVRVFAFEERDAVVDTNIGRVLARWGNQTLRPAEAQRLADSYVPTEGVWLWNQAIMELGALVCGKNPRCSDCPVSRTCRWHAAGRPEPDPAHGSAAVSQKQSRFEGSDRQGRASLVRRLSQGPLGFADIPEAMGWPHDPERAERVLAGLVKEGMVVESRGRYGLPT